MGRTYTLKDYKKLVNQPVFFDANVLIYLFWPSGQYDWEGSYSTAFNRLRKQGNQLIVNFLVVSEVVNRIIRFEHKKNSGNYHSYKAFRESQEGREALADIYTIIKEYILPTFNVQDKAWNNNDLLGFLSIDSLDFSDKAIAQLCMEKGWVLFTNDADFKDTGLTLFSGNPKLRYP